MQIWSQIGHALNRRDALNKKVRLITRFYGNVASHCFSHLFCEATNGMASFGGAATSNFATRIKPFRRLRAVTRKPPMFLKPICTACRLPFYARSQVDTFSTTPSW